MSELERLRNRVDELERVIGVDRSLASRLRAAFGLDPNEASTLGMLLNRNFVTSGALFTVLFAARPDCDWPAPRVTDVYICKLRKKLKPRGITIKTHWGEGWSISVADKGKTRAALMEVA